MVDQRITNPGMLIPEAMAAVQDLVKAAFSAGVPRSTMELVHLRASQVNGCSFCVTSASLSAKKAGEPDERLLAALVLWIGTSNLFNPINVSTRQPAGEATWA